MKAEPAKPAENSARTAFGGRRIAAPAECRWRALCSLCMCDFFFVIFTSFGIFVGFVPS